MVTGKANPLRRNRAVTLIEAVLYISIALALIVGGLVFFQQANTAMKTSTMTRQLSAVVAETKGLLKGASFTDNNNLDIEAFLISAGAVPSGMVKSATEMSTPFGDIDFYGSIYAGNRADILSITINLYNIPQGVCARLLTASSGSTPPPNVLVQGGVPDGGTTLVSSGLVLSSVAQDISFWDRDYVMNATQAGWMCKYGSRFYTSQTTEPTSEPLSGNLTVSMVFLTNR